MCQPRAAVRRGEACGQRPVGTGSPTCTPGTHMLTHMHAGPYLSRPSWETQPSWRATLPRPPRASSSGRERRIRGGERTVRQAGGPPGEWLQAPLRAAAEGGGGAGSDFLASGWLLGVGPSDYGGAGTQPAGTGIMRCLPKCRNPLEQRILHNPCLERGPRVITAWRKQPGPFPLVMWVGGWPHGAWWLSGSSPGQQAQQRGPGTSNIRVRELEAGLQSWGTTPLGSDVLSSPGPSPTQCGRQIPAEWQEAS